MLERLVEEGKLLHGGHPVLAMAAANAKAEQDAAGNRKLSKRKSTGRIDPLVALTMAIGVAARPAPVFDVRAHDRVNAMAKWPYTTQRWQRLRRHKLREHPLCEVCLQVGRIEPAIAVDHRAPITTAATRFRRSTVSLRYAHDATTPRRAPNRRAKTNWLTKGCDVRGYPLDRNHPWYKS